jgi:hypothetical protein
MTFFYPETITMVLGTVRYCDDFVMGFEKQTDAKSMLGELKRRLSKFGLGLNEKKTRLLEFGRFASDQKNAMTWERFNRLLKVFPLPVPRIIRT